MIEVSWASPETPRVYQQDLPMELPAVTNSTCTYSRPRPALLTSSGNPDGWKLDELLSAIEGELLAKRELVSISDGPKGFYVRGALERICGHLQAARQVELGARKMLAGVR